MRAVLDEELVSLDEEGKPDFPELCSCVLMRDSSTPLTFIAFDVLSVEGEPVVTQPYSERRRILEGLQLNAAQWRTPEAFDDGEALSDAVCEHELEGVVAKRRSGRYVSGERARRRTQAAAGAAVRVGANIAVLVQASVDGGLRPEWHRLERWVVRPMDGASALVGQWSHCGTEEGSALRHAAGEREEKNVRLVLGLFVMAVVLALAGSPASAATRDNNCVHPSSGVSLNELFGVPEQFISPICEGLTAGEHWRPVIAYFGADGSDAVYPPGYVPLHANPVDDILAKLTLKVVIDGGTRQQKTYTFSPTDEDAFRTDFRIHDVNPAFPDIPSFFMIPRMAPLSPGRHTYEFIWVQSAPHCDGTSTDENSCLPAGATPLGPRPVNVSTPKPVS